MNFDAIEFCNVFSYSDADVVIQRLPLDEDYWKNQVIIGCTFTVAIEILIVALMVMYWRQIRWTLRKITCPCVSLCIVLYM